MKIKRAQILLALRTENIGHLGWTENPDMPAVGDCKVCAVGAVLRRCGLPNNEIESLASSEIFKASAYGSCSTEEQALELLDEGRWMDALSTIFEGNFTKHDKQKGLERAAKFVKKHFPKEVTLSNETVREARRRGFFSLLLDIECHSNATDEQREMAYAMRTNMDGGGALPPPKIREKMAKIYLDLQYPQHNKRE